MTDRTEAVRLVLAEGGEMTNEEVARSVKERFGIKMKPGTVAVLRATLRWKEAEAQRRALSSRRGWSRIVLDWWRGAVCDSRRWIMAWFGSNNNAGASS
jgi:hypothetical protein